MIKNTQAHGGFRPGIECSKLALLRRNDVSAARGLVVRAGHALRSDRLGGVATNSRNEDDDLRADRRAIVKIDMRASGY